MSTAGKARETAPPPADVPFEAALERLEGIVKEMESGAVSLDACMKKFSEGMQLAALCEKKLSETEKKIEVAMKSGNGGDVVWKELVPAAETGEDGGADRGRQA